MWGQNFINLKTLRYLRLLCFIEFMLLDIETIGFISIKQVNYRLNSKNHVLIVFLFVFDVMYIEIKLLKIIAKSKINTIFANANSALGRLPL